MTSLRIVFMGTPEFSVASLAAINEHSSHQVVGVVTIPDKPTGRGQKISESAVKKYAIEKNLPVLQPVKLKDTGFLEALSAFRADLFVVIAFRMLPKEVWSMPPKGTINLHGSLLPQYRGAAPINRAIMNGEQETGVTTFFINEQIDTGEILLSEKISISPDEDAGSLHDRMKEIGATLIVRTLDVIAQDHIIPISQTTLAHGELLREAPKIFRDDCLINWENPTQLIYNQIRGLSPYPTAFTVLKDKDGNSKNMKIYKTCVTTLEGRQLNPKELYVDTKNNLFIGGKDGLLELLEVQLEGKKRMKASELLNGFDINAFKIE